MDDQHKGEHRTGNRSMHEGVPIWDDRECCCSPEPRWQAVQDEIDERKVAQDRDRDDDNG